MRVKLSQGVTVAEAAAALEDDPDVLYAEPNYIRKLDVLPNDPNFSQLWALPTSTRPTPGTRPPAARA